jgi:hypothetical protein
MSGGDEIDTNSQVSVAKSVLAPVVTSYLVCH